MAQSKKKMTFRERMLEERRKVDEAERSQRFRQRLIRVSITTAHFSVLHGMPIFYCGYCGKPVALFSTHIIQTVQKIPTLFYACSQKCASSGFQRADFIDRLLMQLIQNRVVSTFPAPTGGSGYEGLLEKFKILDSLKLDKLQLLNSLHYLSYKRDIALEEIRLLKEKIDGLTDEIKSLFSADPQENPLMYPLFNTPPEQLSDLDLGYRRELVNTTVLRIRFFNEFLIVRMVPFADESVSSSDEWGRVYNINLRLLHQIESIKAPTDLLHSDEEFSDEGTGEEETTEKEMTDRVPVIEELDAKSADDTN